jgi:hypothetical protein
MNQTGDPADAEKRLEPRDKFGHLPHSPVHVPTDAHVPQPLDAYEGAALARARSRAPGGISPWLFVMATALNTMVASVLAVVITLGLNQDRTSGETQDAGAPPGRSAGNRDSAGVALQPINLRPVAALNQPMLLEPKQPAAMPLQIQPKEAADQAFILTLSGAPAGTILFGANRISSDSWYLPPGAASRLEIVLPEWSTTIFEITVALRRTNGEVAAQTKAWVAVPPPGGMPVAIPKIDEAAARELLVKADRLIAKGDIVGARAIYQRATDMGSGAAALALGTTYDPNRLWSLGALGLAGNKDRARQWYQRAVDLGNSDAKARLAALGF